MSYPEHKKRGRYLAIWLAFKNNRQIVGGAIKLGLNAHNSVGGKVSYATLLAFAILQVLALPSAFAISNSQKVQLEDGTEVKVDTTTSTREQIKILGRALTSKKLGVCSRYFSAVGSIGALLRPTLRFISTFEQGRLGHSSARLQASLLLHCLDSFSTHNTYHLRPGQDMPVPWS